MLDLLIRGGLIIDGTGNPGFYGAVGVEGDRVRILRGDVSALQAARVLDATGRIVCPGFIDMHAHSGLVMLAQPLHEPKVQQGVTTELIGVDGNSYAPFTTHEDFLKFVLPCYEREGKAYLTVAIGCTGGRHRSVTLAEELGRFLTGLGYAPTVVHRDLERE